MTTQDESNGDASPAPGALTPIPGSPFGRILKFHEELTSAALVAQLESEPKSLQRSLNASQGLLLIRDLHGISQQPELLLRLSRLCGKSVENYRQTLTLEHLVHPAVDEILVLGNQPPSGRRPPAQPVPARTASGELPIQFPHRRGWHTDQSFRRPPPDISLFYCVRPCLKGQGQTLFANGIGAYEGLSPELKTKVESLQGLHALLGTGRSERARLAGDRLQPLLSHQQSQRQPIVRTHPVTGERALYLCEGEQMDWLDGPIVGMQPGPHGDGARLVYALMTHYTGPSYTYAHDWDVGDLVIYDNRCLIHSATWYDDSAADRLMWRTTVAGNAGDLYQGERASWIPAAGTRPMQGLENS